MWYHSRSRSYKCKSLGGKYSVSAIVVLPYMSQSTLQEIQQNPKQKPRLSVQKHQLFLHFINRSNQMYCLHRKSDDFIMQMQLFHPWNKKYEL